MNLGEIEKAQKLCRVFGLKLGKWTGTFEQLCRYLNDWGRDKNLRCSKMS